MALQIKVSYETVKADAGEWMSGGSRVQLDCSQHERISLDGLLSLYKVATYITSKEIGDNES